MLFIFSLIFLGLYDRFQRNHSLLRNYPIIGRFRYFAEMAGEYLRQYQYANDWEERPYNRVERSWIYRAAKNISTMGSFGGQTPSSVVFLNSMFPSEPFPHYLLRPIGSYQPMSYFNISGMSYGALSENAILALSHGARQARCWINTGEGALSKHHLAGGCDVVFQIGTAKYGCRTDMGLTNWDKLKEISEIDSVKMIEVKLSQGAKPGKGGILPAAKVTEEIADIRGIPVGVDSISPNRHKDIANPVDLVNYIEKVKEVTGLPVGVKLCLSRHDELDEWFDKIVNTGRGKPDYICIDGSEGGSGAAPIAHMNNVGLPLTEALPMLVDAINRFNLDIVVIASGHLATPEKVAWAMASGADYIVSARGFMFSIGCIQAMKCNTGKCPTGVTSASSYLKNGLDPMDKSTRVANYVRQMIKEVDAIANSCGVVSPQMMGSNHIFHLKKNDD